MPKSDPAPGVRARVHASMLYPWTPASLLTYRCLPEGSAVSVALSEALKGEPGTGVRTPLLRKTCCGRTVIIGR
jgi:hypothetical protein